MGTKSYINEELLLNPTTPEAAYILGFLWGDGRVSKLTNKLTSIIDVELVKDDLDKIRNVFNSVGKWNYSSRQRVNRKPQARLSCSNIPLSIGLRKLNYDIKSISDIGKVINIIPEEIKRYFILGLFDADGCFYFNEKHYLAQCSIAGSHEQDWTTLENILNNLNLSPTISRRYQGKNKSSIIRFCGIKKLTIFANYLYPNGLEFSLERKYNIIKHLL